MNKPRLGIRTERWLPWLIGLLIAGATSPVPHLVKVKIVNVLANPIAGVVAVIIGILFTILTISVTVDAVPALSTLRSRKSHYTQFLHYNRSGLIYTTWALILTLVILYVCSDMATITEQALFFAWALVIGMCIGSYVRIARILNRLFYRTLEYIESDHSTTETKLKLRNLDFSKLDAMIEREAASEAKLQTEASAQVSQSAEGYPTVAMPGESQQSTSMRNG